MYYLIRLLQIGQFSKLVWLCTLNFWHDQSISVLDNQCSHLSDTYQAEAICQKPAESVINLLDFLADCAILLHHFVFTIYLPFLSHFLGFRSRNGKMLSKIEWKPLLLIQSVCICLLNDVMENPCRQGNVVSISNVFLL